MAWSEEPNVTNFLNSAGNWIKNLMGNSSQAAYNSAEKNRAANPITQTKSPQSISSFSGSGGSSSFAQAAPKAAVGSWLPNNLNRNPSQPMGFTESSSAPVQSDMERAYMEAIEAIRRKTETPYAYDGANDALVDQAFQGSLDAINNARNTTNSNYSQSKDMLGELTRSHVANIQGRDREAITSNGEQLQSGYNELYDNRDAELKADRTAELEAKTEMLKRLGIQDAGLGTSGNVQTEAITDNSGNRQEALQQAQSYQASDLTRNTELGQNQAAAGVERQSDLRRQLDSILGNIDNTQAGVMQDIASAKLQGRQADRASWDDQQKYNNETLIALEQARTDQANNDRDYAFKREMADRDAASSASSEAAGTSSRMDLASDMIRRGGVDPTAYESAYTNALSRGNNFTRAGKGDIQAQLLDEIRRNNPTLDPNTINRYLSAVYGYGADKMDAAAQY